MVESTKVGDGAFELELVLVKIKKDTKKKKLKKINKTIPS